MEGSYTPGEQTEPCGMPRNQPNPGLAGSYELTYSNLAEANEIIERLCNG